MLSEKEVENSIKLHYLTESEQEEIARLIKDGFTSGRIDSSDTHISWQLKFNKWEDA
jgi:hypothetical protein